MEKKTMDTLRTMICGELDDIARKGISDHETLDVLKDLLDSAKNIEKIEKYGREKEESKEREENGYSQRSMGRYYVDGQFGRQNSPYLSPDMRGGSFENYPTYGDNFMMGNSQRYYDPAYYDSSYRGNSYLNPEPRKEVIKELEKMMKNASDEKTKAIISELLMKYQ